MKKRQLRRLITVLVVVIFAALGNHFGWFKTAAAPAKIVPPGTYAVHEVFDGDTISVDMDGKIEKVRFIGVDTPETKDPRKEVQCFGLAASSFTKQLLTDQNVKLEADPLNTNRDRYDRLLRYVYLPDGTLVNAKLISDGYGFAYLSFPFQKAEEFRQLETQAREHNKGLWSSCTPTVNQYGGYTSNNAQ